VTARREGFNGPLEVDMNNPCSIGDMALQSKEIIFSIYSHFKIYFKGG
jgi:hypothetical protein